MVMVSLWLVPVLVLSLARTLENKLACRKVRTRDGKTVRNSVNLLVNWRVRR